jgi:hypothetical protein
MGQTEPVVQPATKGSIEILEVAGFVSLGKEAHQRKGGCPEDSLRASLKKARAGRLFCLAAAQEAQPPQTHILPETA